MIPNLIKIGKQILGSTLLLPAYGRVGQGQHFLAAHFALRNTKNCGGEKRSGESEDGPRRRNFVSLRGKQKFFLFARPSGKVLIKIRSLDFRQKKFGF